MRKLIILTIFFTVLMLSITTSAAEDTTPPVPIAGDPARNAVNVPVTTVVSTTFNEPIQEGTTSIQLVKSGTPVPTTSSFSKYVLTVTPDEPLEKGTKYTLILQAGSVTDQAGNPCAYYTRPFTTDGTAPKAIAGSPARNAVNVPVNLVCVSTTFNENIVLGPNWGDIELLPGFPISVSITDNVLRVGLLTYLEKGTTYTLYLPAGSVTDLSGNPIVTYSRPFTTDNTAPVPIAGSPARNAVNVPVNTVITTTFSEDIWSGPNWTLIKLMSSTTEIPISVTYDDNVLTVTPNSPLEAGTKYTLFLPAGSLEDLANNPIADYSRPFTTDGTAPVPIAGNPARNAVNVPVNLPVITTTFNENIMWGPARWDIGLFSSTGSEFPISVSITDNVLSVNLLTFLQAGTLYNLVVPAGSLADLAGNLIAAYSRPFTTIGS